jgi:hypothetical protein
MEHITRVQAVRKTFQPTLQPTLEQERALEEILWRCCDLYNSAP